MKTKKKSRPATHRKINRLWISKRHVEFLYHIGDAKTSQVWVKNKDMPTDTKMWS